MQERDRQDRGRWDGIGFRYEEAVQGVAQGADIIKRVGVSVLANK